jgi:hypothetical protein
VLLSWLVVVVAVTDGASLLGAGIAAIPMRIAGPWFASGAGLAAIGVALETLGVRRAKTAPRR